MELQIPHGFLKRSVLKALIEALLKILNIWELQHKNGSITLYVIYIHMYTIYIYKDS